jgi:hypothetical protein
MQPNKDNMRKWVKALRSGEYRQGAEALARVEPDGVLSYCCLGVACEAAIKDGLELRSYVSESGQKSFDGCLSYLPVLVQEWLGVDDPNPWLGECRAAPMNDNLRWNFDQIADAIEATYLCHLNEKTGVSDATATE